MRAGRAVFFGASLLCLALSQDGPAAVQAPHRLTPGAIFDWKTVSDPQISPDGKRVVFMYHWNDIMSDASWSNLWIAATDGGDLRPLTTGRQRDASPRWSPDGARLAFVSTRNGRANIFVRWMDTGQEAQITDGQEAPSDITWSPDGRQIGFTKLVPGMPPAGVRMPRKPQGALWAAPPIVIDRLVYRYDGRGYLPYGFTHIFAVPATGGTPRPLTTGDYNDSEPVWSGDGRMIFFSSVRKPDADWALGDTEIYSIPSEGGAVQQLTHRAGPDNHPSVSPDGKWLAFTGFDEKTEGYTVTKLYVMGTDGSVLRLVSGAWDRDVGNPRWASDSGGVYVTSEDRGSANIYFFPLAGEVRPITTGAQQVAGFSVSRTGRVAAVVTSPGEPQDVYAFNIGRPTLDRLTNVNGSLLRDVRLGKVEEIWYKSFDGRNIQGWIVTPPDFAPAKKYPLLLYIHGGPYAMYGVDFNLEFQMHAANGYVVLYTNPRGSTGYGHEFANLIFDDYPGDNLHDLMKGVDAVVAGGYVDETKLAITGGSGGGLLTAWTIGHTDRFAVAAAQYPTIDWYSMVPTTDNGYGLGRRRFRQWPWEDPEKYLRHSPMNYVGQVKTPVLIITGEADWRTPISQSEEFYGALRLQKKEARLVRVPDEPHGIRVHPSHRIAKVLFLMDWFDSHLGRHPRESAEEPRPRSPGAAAAHRGDMIRH